MMDKSGLATPDTTPKRKVATLDSLSKSQIAAIRSMPSFDDWKLPKETATRPVSYFLDEAVYEREIANVFRRLPVPIGPSGLLPRNGMSMAHNVYGLPLLLTRDAKGGIHVFLNTCRHKGAKLLEDDNCQEKKRIICPYHGWTYDLDGALLAIPRPETFPGFIKEDHGLAALPCRESGGIIWAILDRKREPDFSDLVPELATDLEHIGIPTAHVYGRKTFEVKANWKLVLEPSQENYHVRRLHANSIGNMFVDTPSVVDTFGPHRRKTQGRGNFDPKLLDNPGQDVWKLVTQVYQLFPNGILITSPYYTSLMITAPISVKESRVDYFMLTPGPAPDSKVEDLFARSYELILKVFGGEDFRAAEISQAGLLSGALDEVIYGGMESTIPRYYEQLDNYVGRP